MQVNEINQLVNLNLIQIFNIFYFIYLAGGATT